MLVPLIDLKFLNELAAGDGGTSIGGTSAVNLKFLSFRRKSC
jgi:hypothetical protein